MKSCRYIIFLIIFIIADKSKAQEWISKIDFRMELGATASTITNMDANKKFHYSAIIGGSASIPLFNSSLYISPGLYITQKGVKLDFEDENKLVAKPTYIQVPLELSYRIDFNEESCLFFNAGGYMALGVVGKFDFKGYDFSNDQSISIFKTAGKPISRFDAGISGSALYEYMSFAVRVGASMGLVRSANKVPEADYWIPIQGKKPVNIQAFISVGYRFFYY